MEQAVTDVQESWKRWRGGQGSSLTEALSQADALTAKPLVVLLTAAQFERWKSGDRVSAETFFERYPVLLSDHEAACDLVYGEYLVRELLGESPGLQEYLDRFPQLAPGLRQLHTYERMTGFLPWFPRSVVGPEGAEGEPDAPAGEEAGPRVGVPDYELIRRIGAGGFGQVFLARNRHDRGFCAVKVIATRSEVELEGIRLYRSYASDHPHLVPIKHVGEVEGFLYYVMPLADDQGENSLPDAPELYTPRTLKQALDHPPPLDEVLAIAYQLLSALGHLHAQGVCHCDVKPENIMRVQGTWRLGDLGLAQLDLDREGIRGTRSYWPPEGPRDHTADLYALGLTLFRLATGASLDRLPDYLAAAGECPPGGRGAARLRPVLARACDSDPARRYQSAGEMTSDLGRIGRTPWTRRNALLGLAALAVISAAGLWARPRVTPDQRGGAGPPRGAFARDLQGDPPEPEQSQIRDLSTRIIELRRQGKWSEAIEPSRSIVETMTRLHGPDHPDTRRAQDRLKMVTAVAALPRAAQDELSQVDALVKTVSNLVAEDRIEAALREEARIYEIRRRLLGEKFEEVALGLIHMGFLKAGLERYKEAEDDTRNGLRILISVIGDDHLEVGLAYHNLASYLLAQKKDDDAVVFLEKALKIRLHRVGKHFFTALTHLSLAYCLQVRAKKVHERDSLSLLDEARGHIRDAEEIAADYRQNAAESRRQLQTAQGQRAEELRSDLERLEGQADVIEKDVKELSATRG
jgi:serine/threonine-protein kinase